MESKTIAVIGAGAVGSLIAAALCTNGTPFSWVVRNPRRRSELASLDVQFPDGGREFNLGSVQILDRIGEVPDCEIIIMAVKAQDVPEALAELPSDKNREILVIANGLLRGDFHLGLLYGGAFLQYGVLVAGEESTLEIGLLGNGATASAVLAGLLNVQFLRCRIEDGIRERMWHKLAMNCVINPITSMLDCENGYLIGHVGGPLVRELVSEISRVISAEAAGDFEPPSKVELLAEIKQLIRLTKNDSSSMREDLRAGRPTEIASLNQAVAAAGRAYDIACPVNEMIAHVISYLSDRGSLRRVAL